jgi:hypothetical protein
MSQTKKTTAFFLAAAHQNEPDETAMARFRRQHLVISNHEFHDYFWKAIGDSSD